MSQRRSVWETPGPGLESPSLIGSSRADVVVVGAGITGTTTALLLQRKGFDVVLLEARQVGSGTTGGTTGKVTSQHGLLYQDLVARHDRDTAQAYADANQDALRLVAALVEETHAKCDFTLASAIVYDPTGSEGDRIEAEYKTTTDLGLPARSLTDTDLPFPIASALEFTDQAHLHPVAYVQALAREFLRLGGRLHEKARALGFEESESGVEIAKEAGIVVADQAVIATLLPFVDRGGFFARTKPSRAYGVAAILGNAPPPGMYISASGPIRSMRPWPGGGKNGAIIVGETHATGHDDATPGRWGDLERWANEHFEVESFEFRWSAQDYSTVDGLPYVGRSPLTKRTLVATGFAKWGLSNGTAAAQILSDLVTGEENAYAEVFSPRRIGGLKAVTELIATNSAVAARFVRDRVRRPALSGPESLEPGDAGLVTVDDETVAAYRDPSGSLHAVRPACTHLGCHVAWNDAENSWDCPCHGSRFGVDGRVFSGPATEALEQVTVAEPDDTNSEPPEDVDELVDEWIDESFPASDPPGEVPPNLKSQAE